MIKTAMLLAAGRGERMRPLTDSTPKPLLTVRGRALLDYHLQALAEAGIEHVVINHAWLGEQIEQYLGRGEHYGLRIEFSPEKNALETAGGIVKAMPLLTKAQGQAFIVVNGDIFTDFDFSLLPDGLDGDLAHLVMIDNPEHHPQGDFGLAQGRLQLKAEHQLTFSGIAVYHRDFFNDMRPVKQPLRPVFERFINANRLSGQHYIGHWTDVGTPQRLQQLNQREACL